MMMLVVLLLAWVGLAMAAAAAFHLAHWYYSTHPCDDDDDWSTRP